MSNLSKFEFVALDIYGKNYLSWVLDAEIHLTAKGLDDSIIEGNTTSSQDKVKAMIFLRHHLDERLKVGYLIVKVTLELWIGLEGRYDHLKATYNDLFMKNHEAHPAGSAPLLEAQTYNDLFMKNHEAHPAGSAPLLEAQTVESHLILKDDVQDGCSQKYDENVEANLASKDDTFDGLDDITHLEAEDFFGDHN
ncbi:uncharacterized protein LOC107009970 [Solanum pennellii]|uniref:Uncharacterized protein LOC107009970 n=1 Tax=Solanum pennellii TaxID=28526 RepID=A0ABM1G1R9_SOLPN|nr:uncharacterized protein LOC107009970 [Solanum pennellii]